MQYSKDAKQYILQCQLIALDKEKHGFESSLMPVFVKTKKEAKDYLSQGRTVILNGLAISKTKGQTYNEKAAAINQTIRLGKNDVEKINITMRLIQRYIDHGSLDRMMQLLKKDAEENFDHFKESIRLNLSANDTQYLIAKNLNEIEAKLSEYPLVSVKQAVVFFGITSTTNPSRLIAKLKKELKIIGFNFGNSRSIQIPAFQFDVANLCVHQPVEKLCHILEGVNDWGVYKWLTSHDSDLGCTPAQAISRPELEEELLYLAGLFKSESTLKDSIFIAERNDKQ